MPKTTGHCCFLGCTMRQCRGCGAMVCVAELHFCEHPGDGPLDALWISKVVQDELWRQARLAPTKEVCGLIDLVNQIVYPIRNVSRDPSRYFVGHDEDTLDAMRRLSGDSAVYHSHPTARAVPSDGDRSSAKHPNQVILSLRYAELNAWRVQSGEWTELAIYQEVSQ